MPAPPHAISPFPGITSRDPISRRLPGCRVFAQAAYLAGHSWPGHEAQPIAGAIAGSQLVMLADCGHIPSIEAPQEYRQAIVNFLRR